MTTNIFEYPLDQLDFWLGWLITLIAIFTVFSFTALLAEIFGWWQHWLDQPRPQARYVNKRRAKG